MTATNDIRKTFLDYFGKHDHEIVSSGPLVPQNDPTLMFTNAGMVPFKNVFTGAETRDIPRATSSQKCVRAGGKHNDLDNVGFTARHHTFFEMLGNFSFGDYFKERAIELAWNLITKEYGIDQKRLLVTVYHEDDEAFDLWKKIAGLPEDRIIRIATNDNFWSMGDTGPCGPSSEIFYDHDPDGSKGIWGDRPGTPDEDGDRFVEIWNLVFMQYEQVSPEERIDLPKPSIDTGMGLERIAAVLQGTHDNYEIDLFQNLIKASADLAGKKAEGEAATSYRVIADHLRSTSFLIADGVLPSNEGRGYVLRRIMRRAMRHAHLLGVEEPLMYRLVPALVREMGGAFGELNRAEALITETLKLEETRFRKMLERGLGLLETETADLKKGDQLSGEVAFKLYDTYGFPLDLTQDALRRDNISVDKDGFNQAMERQRAEARKNWSGSGDAATDKIWLGLLEQHGATEFLGYTTEQAEGLVVAIVKDDKPVVKVGKGDEIRLIVNQTPFYAESGGQAGDHGIIRNPDGLEIRINDTRKMAGDLFVHFGEVLSGSVKVGENVDLIVDAKRRTATRSNHSATHLLHEALRQVLGEHVAQKGSHCDNERLRFDFSHSKPVSDEEIAEIENRVNHVILQNASVGTRLMGMEEAVDAGALALFGEKYADEVRVVSMGNDEDAKSTKAWSVELCGGTHVNRTGDIGLLKIVSEGAVASGVRRIEAVTGIGAKAYLDGQDQLVAELAATLKTSPHEIMPRVQSLLDERKKMEKELSEARKKLALAGGGGSADNGASDIRDLGKVKLLARTVQGIPTKELKSLVDDGKQKIGSGIVTMIGISEEGKAGIVVGVTKDLTDTYDAVDLVKTGAAILGGKGGGGRPDMAQAGGPDSGKAAEALDAIEKQIAGA